MKIRAGSFVPLLALVTAPLLAGEVPIRPFRAEAPSTASPLLDALRKPPERSILECVVEGPGSKSTFRLFSNGLAILLTEGRDGVVHQEHRLLQAEELAVYVARVDEILAPAPASGETRVASGELITTVRLHASSTAGHRFAWRWTGLDSPPFVAASLRTLVADLEQAVRERWKLDDPWKLAPPPNREVLRRADGALWVVVRYDDSVDAVELESADGMQHTKLPRNLLHTLFSREIEERALDQHPAPRR